MKLYVEFDSCVLLCTNSKIPHIQIRSMASALVIGMVHGVVGPKISFPEFNPGNHISTSFIIITRQTEIGRIEPFLNFPFP